MVGGRTADHLLDERLDRRLKRRVIGNQLAKNFCCQALKEDDLGECDGDYMKFLNRLPEVVKSSDENVDEDFRHYNGDNGTSRCSWSDEKVDPVYKMFFQHLTEEGKAYKLEIPSGNGMKAHMKYEEQGQDQEQEQSSLKNDQNRRKPGTTRILRTASKKKDIERPAIESLVPFFEKEFSLDSAKPISHEVDGNSSTMPDTGLLRSAKCLSQSDSDSDMMDEDYKIFLTDFLYDDDHRLIYMPVDGTPIVYDEDESASDSEVMMMDTDSRKPSRASFGRKYSLYTMDVDSGKCLQRSGVSKSSNFRERLMRDLKSPYSQDEYDFYLNEVSCCKPQVRHRELRSRVLKAYKLESCGKSYLHIYEELATKIQAVQYDRYRTLNLLRGFFYWLQNLSHDDAFQPWMDQSCLDVLPRS